MFSWPVYMKPTILGTECINIVLIQKHARVNVQISKPWWRWKSSLMLHDSETDVNKKKIACITLTVSWDLSHDPKLREWCPMYWTEWLVREPLKPRNGHTKKGWCWHDITWDEVNGQAWAVLEEPKGHRVVLYTENSPPTALTLLWQDPIQISTTQHLNVCDNSYSLAWRYSNADSKGKELEN